MAYNNPPSKLLDSQNLKSGHELSLIVTAIHMRPCAHKVHTENDREDNPRDPNGCP